MRHFMKFAVFFIALTATAPALADDLFADVKSGKPEVITIDSGPVRGYEANGSVSFLGIPYAQPPVGNLRWMPPVPPAKWTETRDAGAPGKSCVQTSLFGVFAKRSLEEDCLFINVITPPAATRGTLKPVMVWLHGGGLINGRADDHDGRKLVTDGDVVVVSMNYRLNVFGFMSHPDIDKEGHAISNYGLLDQHEGLRWVQRNIRAFGGDPNNVTLFGESAGGTSTVYHLVSPAAAGLFHKVILQSAVNAGAQISLQAAQKIGSDFATALGCTENIPACMRSKSVAEIVEKADRFVGMSPRTIEGSTIPDVVFKLYAEGKFHRVPILVGNNKDEWNWILSFAELASGKPMVAADYEKVLTGSLGAAVAAKAVAEYPVANFPSPSEAVGRAMTSQQLFCPARRFMRWTSKHVPVYSYEFLDVTAPQYFPPVSYPYGAAHTLEIQYLFPKYHGSQGKVNPLNAEQQKLSDAMVKYWTAFAAKSEPAAPGQPAWPRWSAENEQHMLLNIPQIRVGKDTGTDRKCDFWDSVL